jgi:acetyl-CoA carboxylase biotin carboxyl carrier protein
MLRAKGKGVLMEVGEIKALIELFERSTLTELVLERGETRLTLRRQLPEDQVHTTVSNNPPTAPAPAGQGEIDTSPTQGEQTLPSGCLVRSPIVGTFYRRSSPDEDPYVEVGDRVDVGDTVCIVEAMKVMNEVRTEWAGVVAEILVEDATPVEYGQPLMVIDTLEA